MTTVTQRIGFLGAGRMATALAGGFVKAGVVSAENVAAADVSPDALQRFVAETGCGSADSNQELAERCDVLFLAVKPQQTVAVLQEIASVMTESQLLISIAAGVSIEKLAGRFEKPQRIIRVMPNTPCLVGAGASAFAAGPHATEADRLLAERLLSTVGIALPVPESSLDAVTGLSGSGPAFVFQFIEALSDGGVRMGLPRELATQLAAQTVLGSARMLLESGEHPGVLKDAVTSPGGTTIAGLHALERGGLRAAIVDAVQAAALRSAELGEPS